MPIACTIISLQIMAKVLEGSVTAFGWNSESTGLNNFGVNQLSREDERNKVQWFEHIKRSLRFMFRD